MKRALDVYDEADMAQISKMSKNNIKHTPVTTQAVPNNSNKKKNS